jgi:F-type H+-transporting ATPase subunit delta
MAEDQLVQAYAQAIFEQAVERWRKAVRMVIETLERENDALTRLDNPAEHMEHKKGLVDQLLPAEVDVEVRNFVYLLASKSHVHLLSEVLAEFDRYAARGQIQDAARVASAVQLTDAERTRLEEKVRSRYGESLDFEYRVDKSLLGGVVVRVGDKVIDGSVAGKLAAMRHKLESDR